MSGFTPEWLALREPADTAARSTEVARLVLDSVGRHGHARVVDLGSGTGSNVRHLSPLLSTTQEWRLVDHDAALLALAQTLVPVRVETCVADLRHLNASLFVDCDLVTASALLDLVSEEWLRNFVQHCSRAASAVLVVLNYDGRITCSPADEDDRFLRDLVNSHQRTDKGFGAALGADAGPMVEALLREAGYEVLRASSDWLLGTRDSALQRELIAGWAVAATELSPAETDRIDAWRQRRLAQVDARGSTLLVGHDDVGAVLR
jgi:hypothetical protein